VLTVAPDLVATGSSPAQGKDALDSVQAEMDLPGVAAVTDFSHLSLADYPHVVAFAGLLADLAPLRRL